MAGTTKLMTAGGGGVNLTPASSIASDVTVNVPSSNGTLVSTGETAQVSQAMLASGVAGNGPAFSAYLGTLQTGVAASTWTKVQLNAEEFDTANCFDSTTNYRFTPNVAGYYQLNATLDLFNGSATLNGAKVAIYKNGSVIKASAPMFSTGLFSESIPSVSTVVYLNGSTDYVELYGQYTGGSACSFGWGASWSYFNGALVRAA